MVAEFWFCWSERVFELVKPGMTVDEVEAILGKPETGSDGKDRTIMPILHVTLATRDVKQTAGFFQTAFGLEPIDRPGNIEFPAAWLRIGPGQELHLVQVADFEPSAFEREYGRHIALGYPGSGFAKLKERLAANGAEVLAPQRDTPVERFFFRDPNGYVFEVVNVE